MFSVDQAIIFNVADETIWNTLILSFHWYFLKVYNMVGVAVAMVISTMHEKSCIDSHNAQKFEKKVPNFSLSHISQSQWWNCESITVMKLLSYHNDTTQLSRKSFVTKLRQNSYFNYHWFHQKISTHNLQNRLYTLFPINTYLGSYLCKFSDTRIIMTSQRRCYARDLQNHA